MRSVARQETEPGDDGEDEARRILEDAQAQAEREIQLAQQEMRRLIASAQNLSEEQIEQRLFRIMARINRLQADLVRKVDQALGDRFPELETLYRGQIQTLLGDVRHGLLGCATALFAHDTALASRQLAAAGGLIERRTARLQDTLQDAAVLSTFTDVDSALEDAFHIEILEGTLAEGQDGWSGYQKELVLAQAIRIENALRAADRVGLFEDAGLLEPGEAFSAMFHDNTNSGIALRMMDNSGDKPGGYTHGAGLIDYYNVTLPRSSEWIANATMFHFGHEFGHAFNQSIFNADGVLDWTGPVHVPYRNDGTGWLDQNTIRDSAGNPIAGAEADRFVATDDVIRDLKEQYPDTWQQELQARSEAGGLRSGTAALGNYGWDLRMAPYQQHADSDEAGEWFADMFANWSNGTLADTPGGDAIDQWMDTQMQSWIRMRLEADGLIDPRPEPTTGPR
jgi:hypothetical protein